MRFEFETKMENEIDFYPAKWQIFKVVGWPTPISSIHAHIFSFTPLCNMGFTPTASSTSCVILNTKQPNWKVCCMDNFSF